MSAIEKALNPLTRGEPMTYMNLTIYPLFGEEGGEPAYLTLDQGLGLGQVDLTEVSESGHVPELKLVNRAAQPVLILDGEELIGAKQNRVVNLTILVAAHSTLILPVTCTEAGRWHSNSARFQSSDRTVFSEMRAAKSADVTTSLRSGRRRSANQGAVWNSINEKSERMQAPSDTAAMADIFARYQVQLANFQSSIRALPRQVGALFVINGETRGLDLFDHPATFARLFPKLVQSYALDAIDQTGKQAGSPALAEHGCKEFLAQLRQVKPEPFPALGLGTDLRFDDAGLSGGALAVDEKVVHLCAFRIAAAGKTASGTDTRLQRASARNRAR